MTPTINKNKLVSMMKLLTIEELRLCGVDTFNKFNNHNIDIYISYEEFRNILSSRQDSYIELLFADFLEYDYNPIFPYLHEGSSITIRWEFEILKNRFGITDIEIIDYFDKHGTFPTSRSKICKGYDAYKEIAKEFDVSLECVTKAASPGFTSPAMLKRYFKNEIPNLHGYYFNRKRVVSARRAAHKK